MEAPSCALAPRNRGGLPRAIVTSEWPSETAGMTELEAAKLKESEAKITEKLSGTLVSDV